MSLRLKRIPQLAKRKRITTKLNRALETLRLKALAAYSQDPEFKNSVDSIGTGSSNVPFSNILAKPKGLNAFLGNPDNRNWPTDFPRKFDETDMEERRAAVNEAISQLLQRELRKQEREGLRPTVGQLIEATFGLPKAAIEAESVPLISGSSFS